MSTEELAKRQALLLAEISPERKEAEKQLRADIEREYWRDANNDSDRQPSDYTDYDLVDNNNNEEE